MRSAWKQHLISMPDYALAKDLVINSAESFLCDFVQKQV